MRNLTPVSDVYKAVPTSFFWAPNRRNESLELRFEFPFNLIGKLTMAFLLGQYYGVIQILVQILVGVQNIACVAGVERGRGQGIGRKGKRGGGLGRGGERNFFDLF